MNDRSYSALLVPALVGLVACGGAAAADRDAHIETTIRQTYNFRVHLQGDDIQIKSQNGEVTLTGWVADNFHKSLAEGTVAGLAGVKSVVNHLQVRGEVPAEASDAWLTAKVRTALLYHRLVDATATQVASKGGVVTLTGEAGSVAQKALTGEVALSVEGVKDVQNELKVVAHARKKSMGEKLDDASVTAQVKACLLFHRGTHLLTTSVRTDRGVVAVRGTAKDAAEKELVSRLVAGVHGVKRVDNRMVIAP